MKWFPCALFALATSAALAGEAAFSADGKSVYVCSGQAAVLWTVGVPDGKVTPVDLAKELGAEDEIKGIAPGPKGTCWIASKLTVWQWTPGEGKLERRVVLKGDTIEDIAYNPASDAVFITGRFGEAEPFMENTLVLSKGEKEFVEPKLSLGSVVAPVFDREGRIYFRHENDLWAGRESPWEDKVEYHVFRVAPLGNMVSEGGDLGASRIISAIAPAGKGLYVAMSNMREAELIFLPQPATSKAPTGLRDAWKRMAATLQSITVVPIKGQIAGISALCASPDGAQIFFLAHAEDDGSRKFRLLDTKTGKIRVLGDAPGAKD